MLASEEAVTAWTDRVRAEYLEMPGLTLTRWQMRRFWLLDESLCNAIVDVLVASGFLWLRPDHTYARIGNDGCRAKG
jgi:hypothetical protein